MDQCNFALIIVFFLVVFVLFLCPYERAAIVWARFSLAFSFFPLHFLVVVFRFFFRGPMGGWGGFLRHLPIVL